MSSLGSDADIRKGIDVGASAYIVKGGFDRKIFMETEESLIYGVIMERNKTRIRELIADDALEHFANEMEVVQKGLETIKSEEEPSAPASKEISPHDQLIEAIDRLLPHIEKRTPKQSKACMIKVKTLGRPDSLKADVKTLDKLVNKYKFRDALPIAEKILSDYYPPVNQSLYFLN